jgi:hypothetical protein
MLLERILPSIALFSLTTDLVMDCNAADPSSIKEDGRESGYPTIVTLANIEMNFVTSEISEPDSILVTKPIEMAADRVCGSR